jgi:hypothetical protein
MMRRRLRCKNGHTVAREPGSKCWANPCVRCGEAMEAANKFTGGRPVPMDGHRTPVRVWITMPALKHFNNLSVKQGKALSRAIGDVLEAMAKTATLHQQVRQRPR